MKNLRCFAFIIVLPFLLFTPYTNQVSAGGNPSPDPSIITGNESILDDTIVMTIDDCSVESIVRAEFEILKKRKLSATFFPAMKWMIKEDPKLWRDIVASGFEIGYHTWNHTPGMSPAQLTADFTRFQNQLRLILNDPTYTIHYVRPPTGAWNADWLNWGRDNGLMTVKWNFTAPVATLPFIEGILSNRDKGGSILLIHTGRSDLKWLETNIDGLLSLHAPDGKHYQITSLTKGLHPAA